MQHTRPTGITPSPRPHLSITLLVAGLAAACSSDDDNVGGGGPAPDLDGPPLTTYVARSATSDVVRGDEGFSASATLFSGADEGLDLDYYGNLYQARDDGGGNGELRVFSRARARADLDTFTSPDTDRTIAGATTTLAAPKGIHIVHGAGLVLVADNGDSMVKVFGTQATGDVAPIAATAMPAAPWDVFHDEVTDRLFVALTDGTLVVIDNYAGGGFAGPVSRTITPSDAAMTTQVSVNLHGLAYDRMTDTMVVSDVGMAASDTDGAIFVLANASTADGMVAPASTISGPRTLLGNPVDIALDGERLRVAEKANGAGRMLIFNGVLTGAGGDIAPAVSVAAAAPEAVTTEVLAPTYRADVSDLDGPTAAVLDGVITTQNDAANTGADIRRHDPSDLSMLTGMSTLDAVLGVESVDVDARGNLYVTADDGAGAGSIFVMDRGATSRTTEDFDDARDRQIASTALMAPKGIEVVGDRGLIMVADVGASAVLAFDMESAPTTGMPSVPAALTITTAAPPWDLDYDGVNDRLFVALTNGTVEVYDDLLDGAMAPMAADRTFSIADSAVAGVAYSTNLHGIVYDADDDRLVVSDVVTPSGVGSDTDGRLFVVENASAQDGVADPSVHIEGASTLLGNPVDIAFDGVNLFVAEKANNGGRALAFLDVANIDTSVSTDVAPDVMVAATDVESIVLVPTGLAPTTGGSIEDD